MDHPYKSQPGRAFWGDAVAGKDPAEIADVYRPKFPITRDMAIATAGSCFAQHIGRQFDRRGYALLDLERAPQGLSEDRLHEFGFNLYSARYGNVYSARQLLQLFKRAQGRFRPKEIMWVTDGRYYDPFRPTIEPAGFASEGELRKDLAYHLKRVKSLFTRTDLFVFTFGLTEAWVSRRDRSVYPVCPGVHAGTFDSNRHTFHNFTFNEILADTKAFIKACLKVNRGMRFLFTVSPVPLTATATENHVLSATIYSKSVLRAVCGELQQTYPQVDYFPSYELVASHPIRAQRYQENLRTVSPDGVDEVMNVFFRAHGDTDLPVKEKSNKGPKRRRERKPDLDDDDEDIVCEEEILELFRQ